MTRRSQLCGHCQKRIPGREQASLLLICALSPALHQHQNAGKARRTAREKRGARRMSNGQKVSQCLGIVCSRVHRGGCGREVLLPSFRPNPSPRIFLFLCCRHQPSYGITFMLHVHLKVLGLLRPAKYHLNQSLPFLPSRSEENLDPTSCSEQAEHHTQGRY